MRKRSDLYGKWALISGAAGGLGGAFSAECASMGMNLVMTDIESESLALKAQGLRLQYGTEVLTIACDLTDRKERTRIWETVREKGLFITLLLNAAGIEYQGPFSERSSIELETIIRLNIESTVSMTCHSLSCREGNSPLTIVNVSSLAAFYPMPIKAVYAASKRFLLNWSIALNEELKSSGVRVSALCPAGMPTTPACMKHIEAQGFMGRFTTMNTGDVAAEAVRKALSGRKVIIPGIINRILRTAGSLIPAGLTASLINRRWMARNSISNRMEQEIPYAKPVTEEQGGQENHEGII